MRGRRRAPPPRPAPLARVASAGLTQPFPDAFRGLAPCPSAGTARCLQSWVGKMGSLPVSHLGPHGVLRVPLRSGGQALVAASSRAHVSTGLSPRACCPPAPCTGQSPVPPQQALREAALPPSPLSSGTAQGDALGSHRLSTSPQTVPALLRPRLSPETTLPHLDLGRQSPDGEKTDRAARPTVSCEGSLS